MSASHPKDDNEYTLRAGEVEKVLEWRPDLNLPLKMNIHEKKKVAKGSVSQSMLGTAEISKI